MSNSILSEKIGLICPNWVGDLVMATPAIRAIRQQSPEAELVAIVRPNLLEVFSGLIGPGLLIDRTLLHDPTGKKGPRGLGWFKLLRAERFQTMMVFPNSFRSAIWAGLSGARRRIGLSRNARGWLLTDPVPSPDAKHPHPALDDYNKLAVRFGCEFPTRQMELETTISDEARWKSLREKYEITGDYLAVNTGGAFGSAKNWSREHFTEFSRLAFDRWKLSVVFLCGPAEREFTKSVVADCDRPGVVTVADENPSIGLSKAIVRHARVLVTTDSGPRHFAAAFHVPSITLYGPTDPRWSTNYSRHEIGLRIDLPCSPCQQRVCPLGHHRCMQDLKPQQVIDALEGLLARRMVRAA